MMMMRSVRALGLVSMIALAGGCGVRQAACYRGASEPARVAPAAVREEPTLPAGYELIGAVQAECKSSEQRTGIHDEWLSDVDCSESRLLSALREKAAEQGGDLLVERDCHVHPLSGTRRLGRCAAQVARASDLALLRAPDRAPNSEPAASEAWRIRVNFWPVPGAPAPRSPLRGDSVHELGSLPVNDVRLGEITARCRRGCSLEGVRDGVRITAGRLGANDVVDVHCLQKDAGWVCAGTAAVYEVDPASDPRAR
jgi:hypothetical protein